jgi:hypothetical protein
MSWRVPGRLPFLDEGDRIVATGRYISPDPQGPAKFDLRISETRFERTLPQESALDIGVWTPRLPIAL